MQWRTSPSLHLCGQSFNLESGCQNDIWSSPMPSNSSMIFSLLKKSGAERIENAQSLQTTDLTSKPFIHLHSILWHSYPWLTIPDCQAPPWPTDQSGSYHLNLNKKYIDIWYIWIIYVCKYVLMINHYFVFPFPPLIPPCFLESA